MNTKNIQAEKSVQYKLIETPMNSHEPELISREEENRAAPNSAGANHRFTYGVAVFREGRELDRIVDITVNRDALEGLIAVCNRLQISCEHIPDVVEDFLAELYS